MKLGNNEKIIFSLMKKYPHVNNNGLQLLFRTITNKKVRIDTIIHSFEIKGIVDENTGKLDYDEVEESEIPDIVVNEKILDNLQYLEEPVKLGKFAKSILYLLHKSKKASLQFIATFFKKPDRNVYAILQRLEEKNFVFSYTSRIRHTNLRGRRYRPKYYVLTDLGSLWIEIFQKEITNQKQIDSLLAGPQQEIKDMILEFDNNKT